MGELCPSLLGDKDMGEMLFQPRAILHFGHFCSKHCSPFKTCKYRDHAVENIFNCWAQGELLGRTVILSNVVSQLRIWKMNLQTVLQPEEKVPKLCYWRALPTHQSRLLLPRACRGCKGNRSLKGCTSGDVAVISNCNHSAKGHDHERSLHPDSFAAIATGTRHGLSSPM